MFFFQPRFGHGAFLLCVENLYKKLTGCDLVYTALIGKPSEITYRHGEHVLQKEAENMGLHPLKNIYCIGDNICTDIFGANLYNNYLQKRQQDILAKAGILGSRSIDNLVSYSGSPHLSGAERCYSVLVETGVFSPDGDGPPVSLEHSPRDFLPVESSYQEPAIASQHVLDAVKTILRREEHLCCL